MDSMTSSRPYLIRALFEWIVDNGMTPLILVNTNAPETCVPAGYIEDGRIVLNISMSAVKDLEFGNDFIRFHARFSGVVENVQVPVGAVQAIYARENNMGMLLPEELVMEEKTAEGTGNQTKDADKGKPTLRLIK